MITAALSIDSGVWPGRRAAACDDVVERDGDVIALIERGRFSEALCRLMARHGDSVYGYCRAQLHDAALAEDVRQQVFVALYRGLPRFARRASLRTWLFGIVRHRVLDAARLRARRPVCADDDEIAGVTDPEPSADAALDDRRLRRALREALAELDPRDREAVLLHYQQGFTFKQMAAICGERQGTLSTRVLRALPKLRERIASKLALAHRA